jgi:hypothetical protein
MFPKWVCGALAGLALVGAAAPADAQSRGRLLFLDSTTGDFQTGSVDVAGYYHAAETNQSYSRLVGTTKLVATDSGILAYSLNVGTATTLLLDSLGNVYIEATPTFDKDWLTIAAFGNYLFFNNGSGIGATVALNPNGGITQTWSSTKLSAWSQVTATDNYLFLYNVTTGAYAFGSILADGGIFYQEGSGTGGPPGATLIASVGDNLLLYNASTGAYETAGIYFAGGAGKDFFDKRSGGTLPLNYAQAAGLDGHILLYNPTNGATLIGNFGKTGEFVTTENAMKPGWTNVVAAGEYLLFYSSKSGRYQVYALSTNGHISKVSTGTIGGGYDLVTATRQ